MERQKSSIGKALMGMAGTAAAYYLSKPENRKKVLNMAKKYSSKALKQIKNINESAQEKIDKKIDESKLKKKPKIEVV